VAVKSLNGALGFFVAIDFDKSEPAWLPRKTIADQSHRRRGHPRLSKQCCDLLFRGLEREIADVEFLQRETPSGRGEMDRTEPGTEEGRVETGKRRAGAQIRTLNDALQFRANLAPKIHGRQQKIFI